MLLDKDFQDEAILVNSTPQPMVVSVDHDDTLMKVTVPHILQPNWRRWRSITFETHILLRKLQPCGNLV